jgi:ABC-2 type transport system ATP-binding protein
MPGDVLAHIAFGHEHVWMVRNPDIDQLAESCHTQNLPEPQIRKPNLEDILLAMLREYRRGAIGERTTAAPAESSVENR